MSSDRPPAKESARDHAFFRALEDAFVRLRGAPLLLSPSDWQVAKSWRRDDVPLELVVGVMEKIFERQGASDGGRLAIRSLSYFRPAVAAAWKRIVELQGDPGTERAPEAIDVTARIARLAAALDRVVADATDGPAGEAAALDAAKARAVEGLSSALRSIDGDAEEAERQLFQLDRRMARRLLEGLDESHRKTIEASLEPAFSKLARRLPDDRRRETLERMVERYLRERLGLPVLSLFSAGAGDSVRGG